MDDFLRLLDSRCGTGTGFLEEIMRNMYLWGGLMAAFLIGLASCANEPTTPAEKTSVHNETKAALAEMTAKDPGLQSLLDNSIGYAIFPSVAKGGLIVGGANGRGEVYERGKFIGYTELSQASVGAQAGGQEYSELIIFQDQNALNQFKAGNYSLSADASAVALKAGASADATFKNGIAVFTLPKGGLMVEAAVAGQKFSFQPTTDTTGMER